MLHENRPRPYSLVEIERKAIVDALKYSLGNKEFAADILMIGRSSLYRKISDYEIEPWEYFPVGEVKVMFAGA